MIGLSGDLALKTCTSFVGLYIILNVLNSDLFISENAKIVLKGLLLVYHFVCIFLLVDLWKYLESNKVKNMVAKAVVSTGSDAAAVIDVGALQPEIIKS
jgi:hypothetical protein